MHSFSPRSLRRMRGFFLPFTTAEYTCIVTFSDSTHGSFVYELVGKVLSPGILAEHRMLLDTSKVEPLFVPLTVHNPQIEEAKKSFMDMHPLAKDKEQAGRLKVLGTAQGQSQGAFP
jgi:hypothetical protein